MNNPYTPNQIVRDDFGRPSGILAIDKPVGMTSHDVVDVVRSALGTRQVGHAGALDPFATGVLVIIVGKATKLSNDLMSKTKSYAAQILLGVATDSQDPEGKIMDVSQQTVSMKALRSVIETMSKGYDQFVPVYSSVKVDGQKLRKLGPQTWLF